ncbi:MAG: hypothetical protein FJ087_12825 [Deltaproteobacteria bacterium]|nr:hypothetical protein [Deltaproteobacteria bacterium]
MKSVVALTVLVAFVAAGCYNTYTIPRTELSGLQASESGTATVKDLEGNSLVVKDDTRLFVRSKGGKRYPITPFNFKMTESQLVASDRDYILDLNGIKDEAEVDHVSTWKTALLIGAGAAAVAGLIVLTVFTANSKSQSQ